MRRILLFLLICVCGAAAAREGDERVLRADGTELRVAVIGVDDPARVAMLQRWIAEAAQAPLSVSTRFPLASARVEVRETDRDDDSPVPWGQTARDGEVRVLLYVRRDATFEQLRNDWTAVHELSHLFHPFLGDRGRWLAEGLASYYQNVLRARIGLLDPDEAWRRLDDGFRRGEGATPGIALAEIGRGRGGLMRIYWAGAAYWLEADLALRRDHHSTLDAVLGEYDHCCLRGTGAVSPEAFVAALDRITGAPVFAPLQARYAASTTFPSLDESYRTLGIVRRGNDLQFDTEATATHLRNAVMRGSRAATP